MSEAETSPTGKDESPMKDDASPDVTQTEAAPEADAVPEAHTEMDAGKDAASAPGQDAAPEADATVVTGRHGDTVAQALARGAETGAAPRPDRCERVFNFLSHLGPLFLLVLLAAQVWPDFWHALSGNGLYCPAEARSIEAFFLSMAQSSWLTPGVDGVAHWPFFTWFLGMLAPLPVMLTGSPDPLFPLAGALAAALALIGVWGLARVAGFGAKAALAAGLLLLAAPLFAPLGHFTGPAALAAALMLFSLICFCRGWQVEHAWCSLPAGFALAGLAGLTGGPFFLAVPLVASLCFLIWRGGFRRAQALDAIAGFLLLLLLLGAWLAAIMLREDDGGYLSQLFAGAVCQPWPLPGRWWLAACVAGVGLVPWILAVFGVSWFRVLREAPRTLTASRRNGGAALLWCALVAGLLCTACIPPGHAQPVAVGLAALAAPLLGKAILALPRISGHLLYACASLLLLAGGIVLFGANFELTQGALAGLSPVSIDGEILAALRNMPGLPVLGGVCLLGAVIMARFVRGQHGGGGLVAAGIISVLLAQPATLLIAPELARVPALGLRSLPEIQKAAQARLAPRRAPDRIEVQPGVEVPAPEAVPVPSVAPEAASKPAPEAAAPAGPAEPGPAPATTAPEPPALPAPDVRAPEGGAPEAPGPETRSVPVLPPAAETAHEAVPPAVPAPEAAPRETPGAQDAPGLMEKPGAPAAETPLPASSGEAPSGDAPAGEAPAAGEVTRL